MSQAKKILTELRKEYIRIFENDQHFTYLYGSQAYEGPRLNSDLDLVTVVRDIDENKLNSLVGFVIGMHQKYGLDLDFEVPHERKLVTTFDMMTQAVQGQGFHYNDGKVIVPELVKSPEYLLSDELLQRLLLNTITGKSLQISGDSKLYQAYQNEGWNTLIKVIFNLNRNSMTVAEFVENMIRSGNREGESYMGYKDKSLVIPHLNREVSKRLDGLHKQSLLMIDNSKRYRPESEEFIAMPKWRK